MLKTNQTMLKEKTAPKRTKYKDGDICKILKLIIVGQAI